MIHKELYEKYGIQTDIVFNRPNYCKIDLMVEINRNDRLFFQNSELDLLKENFLKHGFQGGLPSLIQLAENIGEKYKIPIVVTTDAKYLEVGVSSKSDNVNVILQHLTDQFGIKPNECSFWGDEYLELDQGIFGSDSYMITERTKSGDFYDVSDAIGKRPANVKLLGKGVNTFLRFLEDQNKC